MPIRMCDTLRASWMQHNQVVSTMCYHGRYTLTVSLFIVSVAVSACFAEKDWSSRVIQLQPHGEEKPPVVTTVSIQPGGSLVAVAGDDHIVRIWNWETGEFLRKLQDHGDWIRAAAFSPDGTTLATAGYDRKIILWDASSWQKLRVLATHERIIANMVYSHNGTLIATIGFDDMLRVYDVASGKQMYKLSCPCRDMRALAFSPDDQMLAAGGRNGKIRFWSVEDGNSLGDHEAHTRRIRAIAFNATGDHIISCGEDRVIRVCNLADDSHHEMPQRNAKVMALVAYAPGKLATAGSDNIIRLWDLKTHREIGQLTGHTGSITTLASQNGILISGSYDTTVRVWQQDDNVAGDIADSIRTSRFPVLSPPAKESGGGTWRNE